MTEVRSGLLASQLQRLLQLNGPPPGMALNGDITPIVVVGDLRDIAQGPAPVTFGSGHTQGPVAAQAAQVFLANNPAIAAGYNVQVYGLFARIAVDALLSLWVTNDNPLGQTFSTLAQSLDGLNAQAGALPFGGAGGLNTGTGAVQGLIVPTTAAGAVITLPVPILLPPGHTLRVQPNVVNQQLTVGFFGYVSPT